MHADKMLSNLHKDHQMCYKMQRGAKGRSHTHCPLQQSSLLSPPLLSSRDMCTRCASRQFQLSVTDAQTAAVSPFPSLLPLTILLPFLYCLYSSPLYFPLLFLYSVILPVTFPQPDIKAGPVGGRALV